METEKPVDIERLKLHSLAQIENMYRWGSIGTKEMEEYLKLWNATPGRFTFAYWMDGAIRQRERKD